MEIQNCKSLQKLMEIIKKETERGWCSLVDFVNDDILKIKVKRNHTEYIWWELREFHDTDMYITLVKTFVFFRKGTSLFPIKLSVKQKDTGDLCFTYIGKKDIQFLINKYQNVKTKNKAILFINKICEIEYSAKKSTYKYIQLYEIPISKKKV